MGPVKLLLKTSGVSIGLEIIYLFLACCLL